MRKYTFANFIIMALKAWIMGQWLHLESIYDHIFRFITYTYAHETITNNQDSEHIYRRQKFPQAFFVIPSVNPPPKQPLICLMSLWTESL